MAHRVKPDGSAVAAWRNREGEMGKKFKRGSAIIALVLALAAFAAAPASAKPGNGNGNGSGEASWGEASWGEASWVEITISPL